MKIYLPNWVANWIIRSAKKTPFHHLEGYMNRYWFISPKSFIGRKWRDARVHEILRSDKDRHVHDHPWPYTTIILKNGYTEVTQWKTIEEAEAWAIKEQRQGGMAWNPEMNMWDLYLMYEQGCVLHRPAGFAHRLIVQDGRPVTTLFIMGDKVPERWGFYTPEGKVPYNEYLDPDDVTKQAKAITQAYGTSDGRKANG